MYRSKKEPAMALHSLPPEPPVVENTRPLQVPFSIKIFSIKVFGTAVTAVPNTLMDYFK